MESPIYSAQQINGAPLRSGLRQIASQLHHLSDVKQNTGSGHLKGGTMNGIECFDHGDLVLGDCLELMAQLPDHSVDMVLTDPPYSTPVASAFGRQIVKSLSDLSIQEWYFKEVRRHFERIMKPNAPALVFCDDTYYPVLFAVFYDWKRAGLCVWDKGRIGMGKPFRKRHELIFYANQGDVDVNKAEATHIPSIISCPISKQHHGAEKPVALLERLIRGLTHSGATVFDPFSGSGSCAVAAIQSGRRFVAFEKEEKYMAIAAERCRAAEEKGAEPVLSLNTRKPPLETDGCA